MHGVHQFNGGDKANGDAHRVAGDVCAIGQGDGLNPIQPAFACRDALPIMRRNARRRNFCEECGVALRTIAHLNQTGDIQPMFLRHKRGFERKVMRPQNHNPPPRKGPIAGQQHLQSGGTHHSGLVPARKSNGKVAGARSEHNSVKANQPRPFCIGKANNLFWQALYARSVAIYTPSGSSE